MLSWLEYYLDRIYGYYSRALRHWKWRGQYYVLPAYQHLLTPDTPLERLHAARKGFGNRLEDWRYAYPRTGKLLLNRYAAIAVALLLVIGIVSLIHRPGSDTPVAGTMPAVATAPKQTPAPTVPPSRPPAPAPAVVPQTAAQPFIFGLGAQADGAMRQKLYGDAPVGMLTSWFNSPSDLDFMRGWQRSTVPQAYASGKAMHLIVWTGDEEKPLNTKYGPACGRAYPLSDRFANDMRELATIFNGNGSRQSDSTLYVSMFTEFQTYPCQDNRWQGNENYYRALQDRYRLARDIFRQQAPNSQVSLTWGGWQASYDDPATGTGRSLLPYFADVMRASDFQSFQAMDSTSNIRHIADMTRLLHGYGGGDASPSGRVMIAHFKPDNGNGQTWRQDLQQIFTQPYFDALRANGLFAFSFMDEKNMLANDEDYALARRIVRDYAR